MDRFFYKDIQKKITISPKKQREIPLSKLSLTGSISSIKKNEFVQFESSLERDYIYLLEFDREVKNYYEQPFKLFYYHYNTKKYYVPDFFVEYWNGQRKLVEIKYKNDLNENSSLYERKFETAKAFCIENKYDFKILTEEDIRIPLLYNAKFLLSYKYPKYGFNNDDTQIVINVLDKYEKLTVCQLLDFSVESALRKAELLYVIWYMVSNNFVYCNVDSKLNMKTKLWLP